MPKMVSLKQTWDDLDKPSEATSNDYYPSLYLDEKQVKALGLQNARVGTDMILVAKIHVTSLSESERGGKKTHSVSVELREARTEAVETDHEKALYGDEG